MKLPRRSFLHLAAGAAVLPAVVSVANAQTYPTRPVSIVAPFPAGGGTDIVGRIIAERMSISLGRPVIIENISGANGSIGAHRIARAAPDGYAILLAPSGMFVVEPALKPLPYDVVHDFEPITLLTTQPYMVVARRTMPGDDLNSLIAWLRANPDKATAATIGTGGPPQIGGIFFQKATETRFRFVPYRGGAPALLDLAAGQVDVMIAAAGDAMGQVRSGTIKAYAVMAKSRLAAVPDVPTVDEAGAPGTYFSGWFALWAPAGTSKDIIARLNNAVTEALAAPSVGARLADIGQEIFPREQQTPQALRGLQMAEIEKWWPIIKAAGIKAE
jgi:tripartite-type tricarboxylate transporter receptor subunit TctC